MKKWMLILICSALAAGFAVPSLADDAALLTALAAGGTPVLTPAELAVPEGEDGAVLKMLVGISPDGQTMLWRDSSHGLCLTRGGEVIRVRPALDRGAGDPYGTLERQLYLSLTGYPGAEGVAWSPDGKYIVLTDKAKAKQTASAINGLLLLDTETGEVFQLLAFNAKDIRSEEYGSVLEARFDASGRFIYWVGRVNALSRYGYSLYRTDMETAETELLLADLGVFIQGRMLYEDRDESWLLMVSGDGGSGTAQDLYIRYRPGEGMEQTRERGIPSARLLGEGTAYSAGTGYGLIFCAVPDTQSGQARRTADSLVRTASHGSSLLFGALNRITPEGIDLTHYWTLDWDMSADRDPYVSSSVRIGMIPQEAVDILIRLYQDEKITEEEQQTVEELTFQRLRYDPPKISSICQSPGGRCALLCASWRGNAWFYLLDIETMALWPVECTETLVPVFFGSGLNSRFRPGMVWCDGDLFLINNGDFRAFRLEVR